MTYNIEEFKEWLETDSNCWKNFNWGELEWQHILSTTWATEQTWNKVLRKCQGEVSPLSPMKAVKQWIAEVDSRERERERERAK